MTTFNDYLKQRGYTTETITHFNLTKTRFRKWLKQNNSSTYLVDHRTVIRYIEHMRIQHGFKPITINLKLAHLRLYYNYLSHTNNPFQHVKVRGEKRKVKLGLMSEDELQDLYTGLPEETALERRVKILSGFYTFQGVSTRDVVEMVVSDLLLSKGKVIIPKTRRGNRRVLSLHPSQMLLLINEFSGMKHEGEELIYQCLGDANQDKWVFKHLHLELRKYELYKSLADLRYSVIMNWLKRDNLRQVQYNAGHRYITTTEGFLRADYEELRMAIVDKHPLG
jgi:site-specific recombinase XerC